MNSKLEPNKAVMIDVANSFVVMKGACQADESARHRANAPQLRNAPEFHRLNEGRTISLRAWCAASLRERALARHLALEVPQGGQ
jgi:hypothetical protein